MKYLHKYNEMLLEFDLSVNASTIYSDLVSNKDWRKKTSDFFEWEFHFDLIDDIQISIGLLKQQTKFPIGYLLKDDHYYYIDNLTHGYNRLYMQLNIIERIVKIGEISSQMFTKRYLYPTIEELSNIIFIELKEDLGFKLIDDNFGFTSFEFPKMIDYGHSDKRKSMYNEGEVYFPCDHKSKNKPIMRAIYEQFNEIVDFDQLLEEFDNSVFRLYELGYDKIKANLYVTSQRYYSGEWRPERFMIVLEEQFYF